MPVVDLPVDGAGPRCGVGLEVSRFGLRKVVCLGLVAGLAGCASPVVSTATLPVTPVVPVSTGAATSVYVAQQPGSASGSVLQFSATANGGSAPTGSVTAQGLFLTAVYADTKGQVYAAGVPLATGALSGEVEVFAAGAGASTAAARTIASGGAASFSVPNAICVDSGGLLYVAGKNSSVSVFSASATGVTTPFRFIQGSLTQLSNPTGIAVDGTGNIYVANGDPTAGSIVVFGQTATGNVAPTQVIANTAAVPLVGITGIALDPSGNLYVLSNASTSGPATISVFAPGGSVPTKTIAGISTGLAYGGGINVDGAGNIYVLNETPAGSAYTGGVLVFRAAATGNASPANSFTSTNWTVPVSGSGVGLL